MPSSFWKKLRGYDAYPKTAEDFRVRTLSGAIVSIISNALILYLIFAELQLYLNTEVHPELTVDSSRGQRLKINLDIKFPGISCSYLSLDAMDVAGETQFDIEHSIHKQRLDKHGNPKGEEPYKERVDGGSSALVPGGDQCGSCYGAENEEIKCCNTCEDVREAYRRKGWAFSSPDSIAQCVAEGFLEKLKAEVDEGCEIYGYLTVSRASGNVHIAPGKSFQQHSMHVHDLKTFSHISYFNMSHEIINLSFGEEYVGMVNPLDGVSKTSKETSNHRGTMYQYFIKVVPTSYVSLNGEALDTNQFSVTEYSRPVGDTHSNEGHGHSHSGLPGVFFMYEISPIKVTLAETQKTFAEFLTGVCAIVGGIFTVSSLIDSFIYHSLQQLKKKHG